MAEVAKNGDRRNMTLPDHIIAASEEMRELVSVIRAVAPTLITVLLLGESGTGKEIFAQLIHDLSNRHSGPFVTVNCGAIPEGLIESELFGHERGSFTGATQQRKGFFEAANGGTIFLDEIGEMPLLLQVKLLRVLETGKFTRVGSTTQLATNARVIAATNRDLEMDVRAGTFRSDLYYRLRAVMLRLPPLRNRREDIPFLIETMLKEFVQRHSLPEMPQLSPEATERLINHEWRGNIRELRNTLEQIVILVCSTQREQDQCTITREDVDRALNSNASSIEAKWQNDRHLPVFASSTQPKEQTERELIYRALIELRNEIADIKQMLANSGITEGTRSTRTQTLTPLLPTSIVHRPSNGEHTEAVPPLDETEFEAMLRALEHYRGNRRQAAEALGISERTLYRKLRERGLDNREDNDRT